MTNLRTALTALVVVLLVFGWSGAALAAMSGTAPDWANRIDGPTAGPIRMLALFALILAVVLAFVPERESEG